MFLDYFDVLMSKIIFFYKKYIHFNIFSSEKHFESQLLSHSYTPLKMGMIRSPAQTNMAYTIHAIS
jgi:hypothetical protein